MEAAAKKIFVAMSGGVDSSVTAALLKEQGRDVTGIFMKNWSDSAFLKDTTMCPWVADQEDARKAAAVIGIPLYTFDFEKEYREKVVAYMIAGYKAGITPNPDVMCNKEIKFGLFLQKALELGADFVATGHYVRLRRNDEFRISNFEIDSKLKIQNSKLGCQLLQAKDRNKDQSYFLWTLTQEQLKYCVFPIGEYTKPEVREMARKYGLHNAQKKDSQGVCFVGDLDVFEFLKSQIPTHKGKIMTASGREVGEHEGVEFYTIGQRHGIGSPGGGTAYYVVGKDAKKNILYVGEGADDKELYGMALEARAAHWISGNEPELPLRCEARIRYRQSLQKCIVNSLFHVSRFMFHVEFDEPQRAITPGQSVVFYDGDTVLGGAVIVQKV
ncbi:tRNA 2-thiouridine(34) synthase MnmA [Candidatus Azambacteria bacterium RIFCSPHIGHO2_02_FULL_52_12]|uniref:tRNA-specific 2-thiouridylase MnmA n=1 Tax=Candidatus Azambacteria bacterium RIFCSPLOWO2_01_FULL_46_25 TaxID=1797298 RepID=A0A1F5BTG0_9BACT|nr:MAG: tRNA 2-thiouridine(34) synthase MnmA [Candidatus Azambacteria bacterium RIFCSPHIGHO2_02_FULL_52_12]OGD33901.1 MAG: tRNA 2-thiouridine(34) synthase MnmA [Candidatus Azambacteria bacterium RIFCSPLOWO2_01_FULL_46_25]OGD37154.1 MAG: tRNA 2-thiouridine(34) synthase MnmA [Candidatus Azambacteria bacterium RIFCSPHIGHO2_01_FULL_51_74]